MPTPERIKLASLKKRSRTCTVCGSHFVVRNTSIKGLACGPACLTEVRRRLQTGRKASDETKAKMRAGQKAANDANPELARHRREVGTAALKRLWVTQGDELAKRSSDRMRERHQDPDFQQRRDARSRATMLANWNLYRDQWKAQAMSRYASGASHLNKGDAAANRDAAWKWIFTKAQEALHAETSFDEVFSEVHNRLRREMPYDGPQEGSDYMEYLGKLAKAVNSSPEVRAIADPFMSEAIPRFAEEWKTRKRAHAPTP